LRFCSIETVTSTFLTVRQLARLFGLTTQEVRSFESAGILKPTARAPNGHRRYIDEDVLWLKFVLELKATGMPLTEIKDFGDLRGQGDSTLQPRLTILDLHRQRLLLKMKDLLDHSSAIDEEIREYRKLLAKSGKLSGPSIQ
jgi:DNA-binding transcriptional MerR regulator